MSELSLGEQILETVASRRAFLRTAAVGLAVPAALAACNDSGASAAPADRNSQAKADHSGGTNSPHAAAPAASAAATTDEMDRMHEAGIKAFPAKTEGKGNQLLEPRIENGCKVYELTCKKV